MCKRWRSGGKIPWEGLQNIIGQGFDIPWVVGTIERGQYSITVVIESQLKTRRGLIFHGHRVTVPWAGGSKYHRLGFRYTMGMGTIYYVKGVDNIP